MITVGFERSKETLFNALRTRITCDLTNQEAHFTTRWDELVNNPTAYFGEARHALTLMAKNLASLQETLARADEYDCERAMQKFASGYGQSSFRNISAQTASLVHGIRITGNKKDPVTISLEPFDIVIGKKNTKGTTLWGLSSFKTSFMLEDATRKDMTPGTQYVIQSLQQAAKIIEAYYMKEVNSTFPALPVATAPYENENKTKTKTLKAVEKVIEGQMQFDRNEWIKKNLFDIPSEGPTMKEIQAELDKMMKNKTAQVLPNVSVSTRTGTHGYVETTEKVDASFTVGMDYGLIFTDPKGKTFAVRLKNPRFSITRRGDLHEVVEVEGEFKLEDAILLGESPLSARSENAKNPSYWAHMSEDKINGVKQQVLQNLPEDDPTRVLICAISDLLSDHIHNMGTEQEAP